MSKDKKDRIETRSAHKTPAGGNVFLDLGFEREQARALKARSQQKIRERRASISSKVVSPMDAKPRLMKKPKNSVVARKRRVYRQLSEVIAKSAADRKKRELKMLATLERIDPKLVKDGLDLYGGVRESLAHYLATSIPALGGVTCYEMLGSGKRGRVLQLFNAVRYGVFL